MEPTNGTCMWSTLGDLNGDFMDCGNKMCFMFGITNYKL